MDDMTTCEHCTLLTAGEEARVHTLDALRVERLMLILLTEAKDAAAEIATTLHGCQACMGRFAAICLVMYMDMFERLAGGREHAIQAVENSLKAHLDAAAGGNLPPAAEDVPNGTPEQET
ncbi:hypothetical protein [Mycolicibacterium wolinskyi]|uniref:hypothetical protein n=1 Tax=Mycolicibacterium wolinskyi TaxID=59750 RepID=UPI003BA93701